MKHLMRIGVALLLLSTASYVAVPRAQKAPPAPVKKNPLLKLAQAWPDAEELHRRSAAALARPLFASEEPLVFTLAADFKAVNRDRDPNSTLRFPAELKLTRADGKIDVIHVKLGSRGHFRLMARNCDLVPLRVEFPKDEVKGTVFDGQTSLKLGTGCQDNADYEQYTLKEYLAYKISNLLTQKSFRARLTKPVFVDQKSGKTVANRYGMFMENDNDVARRMEGRTVKLQRLVFSDLDRDTLTLMMVFEYMIGNTDLSIFALHNAVVVQTPDRTLYTVPYDFDISGFVHPPYAIPSRDLPIKSVTDRFYRGPCQTAEVINPILANFIAKKDPVMALFDSLPDLKKETKREAKDFLDEFYNTIKSDKNVKRLFADGCSKKAGM